MSGASSFDREIAESWRGAPPLLGCLALTAGLAPVAVAGHGHHGKPLVFVDGDSLAVGTRPYLPGDLRGFNVRQSASISRHAPERVQLLRGLGKFRRCVVWPKIVRPPVGGNSYAGYNDVLAGYMVRARAIAREVKRCLRSRLAR